MKRSSFKISITAFLWLTTALLLGVLAAICLGSLSSMRVVAEKASEVRQVKLPEVAATQGSFINIESLRRLAEVVYISNDPKTRRAARIRAQALASESVFTRNADFYRQARELSSRINALAAIRDREHGARLRLRQLGRSIILTIYSLDGGGSTDLEVKRYLDSALSMSLFQTESPGASREAAANLEKMAAEDIERFGSIIAFCSRQAAANPALAPVCAEQRELLAEYAALTASLGENFTQAYQKWDSVDEALREMRDVVRTDAEFETKDALTAIEETSSLGIRMTILIAVGGVAILILYLAALHWILIRPVRWAGRKLSEIQQGILHTPAPDIRIEELYHVGDLLARFSVHIAELTSHASQLAEDAADKKDLEALMSAVFRVTVDGYCVWAPSRLLTANAELLNMLGFASLEDMQTRYTEAGMAALEEQPEIYQRVLSQGFSRREIMLKSTGGELIPCEASSLPFNRQDGIWILSYFRDLRRQKETEEELRTAKDQAEDAARAKSEFLARMSHEIRTPMNGVLGLTHAALEGSPLPAQRRYLEKIQASARILLRVINDILDFSKIENGRLDLESRPFLFSQLLTTVEDLFKGTAEEKGLRFTVNADPRIPEYVVGDELRLSQVLLNLCGNAVKFTDSGSVTLDIALEEEREADLCLRFTVSDTGVGMSDEQLGRLFQPFVQADTSTTRKYGGTGLGLVISKLIVEMMRGSIRADSEAGRGSSFSFTVLLDKFNGRADPEENASDGTADRAAELRGLRVLLAEDNEINQEVALTLLESLGCAAVIASNGEEALEILAKQEVDAVLMDIQMPVMDGFTATRAIRENPNERTRGLPIIAMTAHAMQEDRDKSLAAGMDEHITKPIDIGQLKTALLRSAGRGK